MSAVDCYVEFSRIPWEHRLDIIDQLFQDLQFILDDLEDKYPEMSRVELMENF